MEITAKNTSNFVDNTGHAIGSLTLYRLDHFLLDREVAAGVALHATRREWPPSVKGGTESAAVIAVSFSKSN
jgi:hypothetical protein